MGGSTEVPPTPPTHGCSWWGNPKPHPPPHGPILVLGGLCLLAAASSLPTQWSYLSRAVGGGWVGAGWRTGGGCWWCLGLQCCWVSAQCEGGRGDGCALFVGRCPSGGAELCLVPMPGRSGDPFPVDPQLQNPLPLSWMGRVGALLCTSPALSLLSGVLCRH